MKPKRRERATNFIFLHPPTQPPVVVAQAFARGPEDISMFFLFFLLVISARKACCTRMDPPSFESGSSPSGLIDHAICCIMLPPGKIRPHPTLIIGHSTTSTTSTDPPGPSSERDDENILRTKRAAVSSASSSSSPSIRSPHLRWVHKSASPSTSSSNIRTGALAVNGAGSQHLNFFYNVFYKPLIARCYAASYSNEFVDTHAEHSLTTPETPALAICLSAIVRDQLQQNPSGGITGIVASCESFNENNDVRVCVVPIHSGGIDPGWGCGLNDEDIVGGGSLGLQSVSVENGGSSSTSTSTNTNGGGFLTMGKGSPQSNSILSGRLFNFKQRHNCAADEAWEKLSQREAVEWVTAAIGRKKEDVSVVVLGYDEQMVQKEETKSEDFTQIEDHHSPPPSSPPPPGWIKLK